MKRNLNKVVMATFAMITSVAVLLLAAYAWYTLSTNPEIKGLNFSVSGEQAILISKTNADDASYKLSESLTEELENCKSLVPVSTVDGENWFVCKYDAMGNVLQDQVKEGATVVDTQFDYMSFPSGSNNLLNSGTNTAAEGQENGGGTGESGEGTNTIFYIWQDIYLKTTEDQVNVYLTVPNNSDDYVQDETENNHYGSYVMSYAKSDDEQNPVITLLDGGSETCVRVGMKVLGEVTKNVKNAEPNGNDSGSLFIYEPNADKRSSLDKSSSEYRTDKYISGFEAKSFYTVGGQTGQSSLTYADVANGEYYLPTYPVASRNATIGGETVTDGIASVFPVDHLIVQKKSSWKNDSQTTDPENPENPTALNEGEGSENATDPSTPSEGSGLNPSGFNSTMIGQMGKFIAEDKLATIYPTGKVLNNSNTDYAATSLDAGQTVLSDRSGVKITTLTKDKPQKVRLYFWVEGQDVDCWNDISSTNFLVNLEFSGQTN